MKRLFIIICAVLLVSNIQSEDGSQLWLRYQKKGTCRVTANLRSATINVAKEELTNYCSKPRVALVVNKSLMDELTTDGYWLHGDTIEAATARGLLYGVYGLLRCQYLNKSNLQSEKSVPAFALRLLNHWDNLDGTIERGYAGNSIFWPIAQHTAQKTRHLIDYARANASIGINGTVLNNVNASPKMLTTIYLKEVKRIASILRPYGIKVYLSINFATPMALGETSTADPLDAKVSLWWKNKVKEIYKLIPDFGGFLVKANSEGQPGPGDFGRTHAEGANMLADALLPYGGIVMWRCFVYGANHKGEDRVKQAVSEFKPLDGQFRDNVILQTKNGPLDFQPREPYSPVFDQIVHTPNMPELQITQEYLGQSKHLVFLAPMWEEFFKQVMPNVELSLPFETKHDIAGQSAKPQLKGIAGVANIGDDVNWCGHHFSQANWYALGRMAWNPEMASESIALEWLEQTFTDNKAFLTPVQHMMVESREACVNYMMPLGLHHIFKFDHHYGPEPDGFKAEYPLEWCPVYYHQADSIGVGFNRSSTGTNATAQYREPYKSQYDWVRTCPENLLLWFHHVPWDYMMNDGRTLWQNLNAKYNLGVRQVKDMQDVWQRVRPYVDEQRWREVNERLVIQFDNALEWRNVCLKYFQTFSKQPIED